MRRRYIEERYRLLPYIYTVAEETYRDGMPMMRPLFLEFPHVTPDGTPMDLIGGGAEFLLGPDLLCAPNPSPEEIAPYELHLPPGKWYDYWTGIPVGTVGKTQARDAEVRDVFLQNKQVLLKPELSKVPIYVRGGAILPLQSLVQNIDEIPAGPLILRVYLPAKDQTCQGSVYSDDGHTLEYRQGNYYRVSATCKLATDGTITVTLEATEGSYRPPWKSLRVELVGTPRAPTEALMSGKKLPLTLNNGLPGATFRTLSKSTQILFR
jgi:alpha-glucosidase